MSARCSGILNSTAGRAGFLDGGPLLDDSWRRRADEIGRSAPARARARLFAGAVVVAAACAALGVHFRLRALRPDARRAWRFSTTTAAGWR